MGVRRKSHHTTTRVVVPTGGPAGQGGNSSAPLVGQGNAGSDGPAGNLGGLP